MSEYGKDQIESFEGLEAVRKRPGMYIGSTGGRGLHHLVFEVVDNSVDEAMAGYCDKITVTLNSDGSVTVSDNGRGIPVGDKEGESAVNMIMTELHAGGKFDSDAYQVSGGLHGVGVSVVNALSTQLNVDIKRDGSYWTQSFDYGEPQGLEEQRSLREDEDTGTEIRFWPDVEIMETGDFDFDTLRSRLENLAYLNPGVEMVLSDERHDDPEEQQEVSYRYDGGISEFVKHLNEGRESLHNDVIRVQGEQTTDEGHSVAVDIAMQYTRSTASDDSIHSFANNIETASGGTHETGFKTAITRVVNNYAEENDLFSELDTDRLGGSFVREGLTAVVSVKHSDPQFEGQTKAKLGNSSVRGVVSSVVGDVFSQYLEEHPSTSEAIVQKAIEAYEANKAAQEAEELTRKSAVSNTTLPGKLSDCAKGTGSEDAELFIVEGDSAGGSAKQGRNPEFQAILPLKGKVLNVEKKRNRLDRVLEHDQIRNLITALGTGVNDEFDIDELRYDTIVLFTDADVDGAHIQTLLLTFFFRYMPELLENGHIYAAKPPLYRIRYNGNTYDAMTEDERDEIIEDVCNGSPSSIQRFKGLGEMSPDQLWDATMNPKTRRFEQITLEDAAEADRIVNVLMGDKVGPRRDFIRDNATDADFIDI